MQSRSLPVLMPRIAGQRWSCHSCGDCCRTLVGHLTDAERKRILDQDWAAELGVAPVVRTGRSWALNKRPDGACVFLDDANRCRIHARYGESRKPLACRIFPFSVRATDGGWRASLRFDCPSVTASRGDSIERHREWVERLVGELHHHVDRRSRVLHLRRGIVAERRETDALMRAMRQWLGDREVPISDRIAGAAHVTCLLMSATLEKVRGERFGELVEVLFDTLPGELEAVAEPPTSKQRGMLRQIAFAHAEHVTLAEIRSGVVGRMRERCRQLRSARAFLAGRGIVPPIPGLASNIPFSAVESVRPATDDRKPIEDLLMRYLTARIEGDAVFGEGYYGWPVIEGWAALWLGVAAAGWIARHEAAAHGRDRLSVQDAGKALGVVDRAATRLPALGAWAERMRVGFLSRDDGIARLAGRYAMAED